MITNRPKRIRGFAYRGYYRYFLTTCTACRQPLFSDGSLVDAVLLSLRQSARLFEFAILAYCFMPDHVHVLLSAESVRSDFVAFVKRFKQLSGFDYARSHVHARLWQPGYYERVLRHDEATPALVRYILANPVRAGLVADIGTYPFAGSDVYSAAEVATAFDGPSRQA